MTIKKIYEEYKEKVFLGVITVLVCINIAGEWLDFTDDDKSEDFDLVVVICSSITQLSSVVYASFKFINYGSGHRFTQLRDDIRADAARENIQLRDNIRADAARETEQLRIDIGEIKSDAETESAGIRTAIDEKSTTTDKNVSDLSDMMTVTLAQILDRLPNR